MRIPDPDSEGKKHPIPDPQHWSGYFAAKLKCFRQKIPKNVYMFYDKKLIYYSKELSIYMNLVFFIII
jgi:hypothetical protein